MNRLSTETQNAAAMPQESWYQCPSLTQIISKIQAVAFEILSTALFIICLPVLTIFEMSHGSTYHRPNYSIFQGTLFFNSLTAVKIYLAVFSIFLNPEALSHNHLTLCVEWGRRDILDYLISQGLPVNSPDSIYYCPPTPIRAAVWNNDIPLVEHLISKGARLSWRGFSGEGSTVEVALNKAIYCENFEMIKFLIEKKAPLNLPVNASSCNPIFSFMDRNEINQATKIKILTLLLQNRADPNHNQCSEPLARAIIRADEEAVKLLLHYGARVDLFTGDTHTSRTTRHSPSIEELANGCNNLEIKRLIREKIPRPQPNPSGNVMSSPIDDSYTTNINQSIPILARTAFANSALEDLRLKIINNSTPEELLGLDPYRFTLADLNAAKRRLARKAHPDKNSNSPTAQAVFTCIHSAYERLSRRFSV